MDVPNVRRTEYQLVSCIPFLFGKINVGFARLNACTLKVNIDDGFLNLMSPDGTSKDDVKVPEGEIGTQISAGFDDGKDLLVTIVSAMAEEQVSFAIPTFGCMCAYKLVGHLIQGSPERLLVHTPARLVDIFCLFLVHLHFYAHPFIVLTDVILSCMYFFMA
jgi:Eukaryotic elongation factor 5A hypusine, DNA-binding OB fold